MSADELRQAAETLRERAQATYEGPWEATTDLPGITRGQSVIAQSGEEGYCITDELPIADATFIATMHPGVGLALADWLDREAGYSGWQAPEAGAIARLINGDKP